MVLKKHLTLEAVLVFIVAMLLFTYGLFNREFIEFESRFAVFAQEMLRHGPSFFATTYGQPYPDYPGTQTVIIYILALITGKLDIIEAALPSAIVSALTISLLFLTVAKVHRGWARYSVLMTLLTYQFFVSARGLTMDPFIMFATMWAFYMAYRPGEQAIHFKQWLCLCLPLIFGFLIRGPIGLVIPAGVCFIYLVLERNWRNCSLFAVYGALLLVVLLGLLMLAALYQGGKAFAYQVMVMQIFGRLSDNHNHQPFAYFTDPFVNYAFSYELAILVIILNFKRLWTLHPSPAVKLLQAAIAWVIIVLIGMSIPEVRKIRYIMPIVPALAILAGYLWVMPEQTRGVRIIRNIFNIVLTAFPFICLLLVISCIALNQIKGLHLHAHYVSATFLLTLLAAASTYIMIRGGLSQMRVWQYRVIFLAFASFAVTEIFVVTPIEVSLNRTAPFVEKVMLEKMPKDEIVFLSIGEDAEPIKFVAAYGRDLPLKFLNEVQGNDSHLIYITKKTIFDDLPDMVRDQARILVNGKIGHSEMIAFRMQGSAKPMENVAAVLPIID